VVEAGVAGVVGPALVHLLVGLSSVFFRSRSCGWLDLRLDVVAGWTCYAWVAAGEEELVWCGVLPVIDLERMMRLTKILRLCDGIRAVFVPA